MSYQFTKKTQLAYDLLLERYKSYPNAYELPNPEERKWQVKFEELARMGTAQFLQWQIEFTKQTRERREAISRVEEANNKYWKAEPKAQQYAQTQLTSANEQREILYAETVEIINKHLADKVGPFWKVVSLNEHGARLIINRTTDPNPALLVEDNPNIVRFGYDVEFTFRSFFGEDSSFVPQLNLGTPGSFPILYGDNGRAQFYIELGKLLSNEDLLSHLESIMLGYSEKVEKYKSDIKYYENFLNNPTGV